MADSQSERLQTFQRFDLDLQLGHGSRRGRLVEDLLFGGLDFVVRRLFQVLDVLGVESGEGRREDRRGLAPALEHLQLA